MISPRYPYFNNNLQYILIYNLSNKLKGNHIYFLTESTIILVLVLMSNNYRNLASRKKVNNVCKSAFISEGIRILGDICCGNMKNVHLRKAKIT